MMLDESMPENHMAPIHPETGEVWGEKLWELVELATDWRYESDDDLRKEAEAEYKAAKEGVTFEERPLFRQSTFMLGAAYKDMTPREMYHCHPKTWEKVPDDAKAKFEVRVDAGYSFLGQKEAAFRPRRRVPNAAMLLLGMAGALVDPMMLDDMDEWAPGGERSDWEPCADCPIPSSCRRRESCVKANAKRSGGRNDES
jgi:hypothetical protein